MNMIRVSPDGRFSCWHQPGADLDYGFNWKDLGELDPDQVYLEDGETITSSAWITPDGLTISREMISEDGTITAAFFAGGEDGTDYLIKNRILTSEGRTDIRTITLICKVW